MKLSKKETEELKAHAIKWLREHLKPGTVVYTNLLHVSRSGMTRDISAHVVIDGEIVTISGYVARVLGYQHRDNGGVRQGGCGMDMGFHLVHNLSYALHGREDVNVPPEYNGRPYTPTETSYRAGYSLEHRWI